MNIETWPRSLAFLGCVLIPAGSGCGETQDPAEGSFQDADETANPPLDVGAGELDPDECISDPKVGVTGLKYQCSGAFLAAIGGEYNGSSFSFYVPSPTSTGFGVGEESYDQAKVMACCGEQDLSEDIAPHVAENCLLDFRQQACSSIAVGLAKAINDGTVPTVYKPKVIQIQNYIAAHATECIAGLNPDTNDLPRVLSAVWSLPTSGVPWEPTVNDVYLEIDFAALQSDGLYAPAGGPDTCRSLNDNNDTVFSDENTSPLTLTVSVELEEGEGEISGPVYQGAPVVGGVAFESLATSCVYPYCSFAEFSADAAGNWAIDRMVLFAEGDFIMSNGIGSVTITDGRIELYSQALGTATGGGYQVPAGDAYFVVTGNAGGENAMLMLTNATDITATDATGLWVVDPITLEYEDDLSQIWTMTLDAADWL